MSRQKIKTQYPGVRYYEHPTRKMRNGQPDRYFSIRYKVDGVLTEETLGWATEGWNAEKAHDIRSKVKKGHRIGDGPASVAEMRAQGEERRKAAAEAARRDAVLDMTVETFFKALFALAVDTIIVMYHTASVRRRYGKYSIPGIACTD